MCDANVSLDQGKKKNASTKKNKNKNVNTRMNAFENLNSNTNASKNTCKKLYTNINTNINTDVNLHENKYLDIDDTPSNIDQHKKYAHQTLALSPRHGLIFVGNLIVGLLKDSSAERQGVKVGWRITDVNGNAQPDNTSNISQAISMTKDKGKHTVITFKKLKQRLQNSKRKEKPKSSKLKDVADSKTPIIAMDRKSQSDKKSNLSRLIGMTKDKVKSTLMTNEKQNGIKKKAIACSRKYCMPSKDWKIVNLSNQNCPTITGFRI